MHPDAHAAQRPPRHILVQHRLVAEITAGAAPFLGDVDAQEAEFARPAPQLVPDMPEPARLGIVRQHLALDKADPGIAKALDVFVAPGALELQRHVRSSQRCNQRGAMRIAPSS